MDTQGFMLAVDGSGRQQSTAQDLNDRQELITNLYWHEDLDLPEVMSIMEEKHKFKATAEQYKGAFNRWKLKKNLTRYDMRHITRITKRRQEHEDKATRFELYGRSIPDDKIERSNQRNAVDRPTGLQPPQETSNTPAYIFYDTPSVYHSVPSTPISHYQNAPSTPMSLDFATPQEYTSDHEIGLSPPLDAPAELCAIPEATISSEGSSKACPSADGSPTPRQPYSSPSHHSTDRGNNPHSRLNGFEESSEAGGTDEAFHKAVSRADPTCSMVLSDRYLYGRLGRIKLRLNEADLGPWLWTIPFKHARLSSMFEAWSISVFVPRYFDILLRLKSRAWNAHVVESQTLHFVSRKPLLPWDPESIALSPDALGLHLSDGSSLPIGDHDDHLVDLHRDSHFNLYGASYEWDGWHKLADPNVFLCPLAECVFYNDCNNESASEALSLLELGRDGRVAFEGAMIRGRLKWLRWFSIAEPKVLDKSLMGFGSEHFESVFDWLCPIHRQSCLYSALHYSIRFSSVSVTETLIDCGATVCGQRSFESCSALGIAIRLNRIGHVGLLLRRGVDPNMVCCGPLTPIQLACLFGRKEIFALLLFALEPHHTLGDLFSHGLMGGAGRG